MRDAVVTLADVRSALHTDASSAEKITDDALARIARDNGKLHAFVTVDAERALSDARHIDALRKLGANLGPLAGAPIGVKDIIDVAGHPTRGGSLTRADAPTAERDAPVVARLRAAGAIIIGKTHTVEYAFGGWGTNETIGTPHNPRDRSEPRVPGGSSSGSGVAVADGLCVAALGSDTGGSIRLPASFCGIVGLKTTVGLVDKGGVLPLTPMLDTIGPLTSNVADAAALLSVLAPSQDGWSAGWSQRLNALANGRVADLTGSRIAVIANLDVDLDAETARVFRETCERLTALGAAVGQVSTSETIRDLAAPCGELLAIDAYRHYGHFAEADPNLLGAPVRRRILAGRDIPAHRLMGFLEHREEKKREFAVLFEKFDAILMPTTPFPAPSIAEYDENAPPSLLTRFVNYLDLAALSLPMGATREGLPIGMQIVVPGFHEPVALEIGAALEADLGALWLRSNPA